MSIPAATLAAWHRRRPRLAAIGTAAAILALTPASEAAPALSVQLNGTNRITLSWQGEGTLQSSPEVAGPWTNLPSANNPYVTGTAGGRSFFRLKLPVVFSPTNLSGLRLWLDAGAGVTLDGNGVSQWEDQSGHSNHAVQVTAARRPALASGALNSLPVVRFDGTNDQLVLQRHAASNDFTLFAVARTTQGHEVDVESNAQHSNLGYTGQRYLFGGGVNFNDWGEAGLSFGTNGLSVYEYGPNQFFSDHFAPLAVHEGTIGEGFRLLNLNYAGQRPTLRADGALVRTGLRSSRPASVFPRAIGFGTTGFGDSPFAGDVAEILLYDRRLTAEEDAAVTRHLVGKYRLYTVPNRPVTLLAQAVAPGQIVLSWHQAGTNTLRSAVVERRQGMATAFAALATVEDYSSFFDTNAVPGTLHTYRLRSMNYAGDESLSAEAVVTPPVSGASWPAEGIRLWVQAGSRHEAERAGTWQDLTGSTNDAYQAATTNRPQVIYSAVNGWPAVRFDGAGDQLVWRDSVVSNSFTVFAVAQADTGHEIDVESNAQYSNGGYAGQRFLFGGVVNFNDWGEVGLSLGTNGLSAYEYGPNQFFSDHFAPLAVHEAAWGTGFRLLALAYSNQVPSLFVDGAFAHTGLPSSRSASVFSRTLGHGTTGFGDSPFAGSLAEAIFFNRSLTEAERQSVFDYLHGKYVAAPASADTDGDGLPDAWEILHGLDPQSSLDAVLDPDGDGLLNNEEWVFGTNPNVNNLPGGGSGAIRIHTPLQ